MKATLGTLTQQRWQEILSRHDVLEAPEYRRQHPRHILHSVTVKFAFEDSASPVVRTGRVLNASASGLMIRQYQDIPPGTILVMAVTLDDETFMLAGQVTHSTQSVGGFKIGVELQFADEQD